MAVMRKLIPPIVLLVMVCGVALALREILKKKALADSTVVQVEGALDSLDPTTRAAVVSKLAVDEARHVTRS